MPVAKKQVSALVNLEINPLSVHLGCLVDNIQKIVKPIKFLQLFSLNNTDTTIEPDGRLKIRPHSLHPPN